MRWPRFARHDERSRYLCGTTLVIALFCLVIPVGTVHALRIDFPSRVIQIGETVQFEAEAQDVPDAVSFQWDFDDGTGGSGRTVSHAWSEVGIYIVTLTAQSTSGETHKSSDFVNILPARPNDRTYKRAWELIRTRIVGTVEWLESTQQYPHYRYPLRNLSYEEGIFSPKWDLRLGWTGGFWVGSLWKMYARTGEPEFLEFANAWNETILGEEEVNNHDRGFVYYNSSSLGYEVTGNPLYLQSARKAAEQLVWMYDFGGTGLIPIYSSSQVTIIDTMMNLQVLWWMGQFEDANPRFYEVALAHAEKTRDAFIRPDGSTWQSVHFDKETGEVLSKETRQGLDHSDTSTWSRGQAWAIYGFSETARATGLESFLTASERVSDFFIDNLPPDLVPWFDFSPRIVENPNAHLKDSSAASIAAAGLLNLAEIHPDADATQRYREAAEAIVQSLITNYLAPFGDETVSVPGMLIHGCWFWGLPERRDSELIWGTYYLLDALERLIAVPEILDLRMTNLTTKNQTVSEGDRLRFEAQVSAHRLEFADVRLDLSQLGAGGGVLPNEFDRATGEAIWIVDSAHPISSDIVVRLTLADGLGRTTERLHHVNSTSGIEHWRDYGREESNEETSRIDNTRTGSR